MDLSSSCPCGSGNTYGDCCAPFHQGILQPAMAEQLMRSRYTAYTHTNIPYIINTTLPSQQAMLDQQALRHWSETTHWLKLEILACSPIFARHFAEVEFRAFFQAENPLNPPHIHHERSLFIYLNQRWFFIDPNVPVASQKQPCICGSGKKFKHCCAKTIAQYIEL